ncbi:MAG: tRNA preQ1(34) S-adenosylmethionine ribosyltransferase-isomerase QueA [Elusimicrobiales bacterium]
MNTKEIMERFKRLDTDKLIAEKPLEQRDMSRLLVIERRNKKIYHRRFKDIVEYLRKGDCIVLNESKVIKARFNVYSDNGSQRDVIFISPVEGNFKLWRCISRKLSDKKRYFVDEDRYFILKNRHNEGYNIVEFNRDFTFDDIDKKGMVPLPHYILKKRKNKKDEIYLDEQRYQTVYASEKGSIAAPTAGFHFTENLIDEIKKMGVSIAKIVLHIGYGTFKMVRTDPDNFIMPSEYAKITPEACNVINLSKKSGGRIFVVGTSSMRAIEKMNDGSMVISQECYSEIFIKPPWNFKIADAFITNLHLPHSPPLYMVLAFCGDEKLLYDAYSQAVELGYRFYSYGDASIIL